MTIKENLIIALPKGRVLEDFLPLLEGTEFALIQKPNETRKILLDTQTPEVKVLVIRGWDVPTYVTFGAAHIGVVGKDILLEKKSDEFAELADLKIGLCRISLAGNSNAIHGKKRLKVATKYPDTARKYLESKGIQSEIVYLHGSQEIAPSLGLADAIVDLVDSGKTLTENGLEELEIIREISSRMIVNKAALKTKSALIEKIKQILTT